jgi:hypothetical protein
LSDSDPRGNAGARPGAVALVVAVFAAWCWVAWANLYWYNLPWADTWASVAPAATGLPPFHINAPLLANFSGSDHVWGLHFPGAPLLYSVVFSCLRFRPELAVLMFMILWVALAACTGWLAFRTTGRGFWAVAAAAVILADRSLFAIAQFHRPEMVAALDLVLVWVTLAGVEPIRGGVRHVGAAIAFMLLPVLHPMTLALGAIGCVVLALRAVRRRGTEGTPTVASCCGFTAGCTILFLWFYLQPEAWSQFYDHANSRKIPISPGSIFRQAFQESYYPLFTGHVLIAAAFVVAVWVMFKWMRGHPPSDRVVGVGAAIVALCLFVQLSFKNSLYRSICLPECVILVVGILAGLDSKAAGMRWIRVLACLAVAAHGLFWAGRTARYIESGQPHIREELARIVDELPKGRQILIPEALWEAAVKDPGRFDLNTLPQMASPARRMAYESLVYGRLSSGDVVVVDRLQLNQPRTDFIHGGWIEGKRYTHVLPGRTEWGYDMTVWVKAP